MVSVKSDAGYVAKKRLELELGAAAKESVPAPRSSSSSAAGVSLTDNTPRNQNEHKAPVDPDAW